MSGKLPTQTYHEIDRERVDFEFLRNKLKIKQFEAKKNFAEKHPQAHKFFSDKGVTLEKIREHSAKVIGAGALTGSLLLAPPTGAGFLPQIQKISEKLKTQGLGDTYLPTQKLLIDDLKDLLPGNVRPLTHDEEKKIEPVVQSITGIKAKGTLEGEHLNTTYGLIGAEQHLRRFPGDSLSGHGKGNVLSEGMAPGLGAWGYFASSKDRLSYDLENTERWYAVVQTLYLPDWKSRLPYLRDWYKYRKVLIVNTNNGNAVVAAVADSGPAAWTGKHFGGSPEVMEHLGGPKYKKGPVLLFFVDDPENKVPLGPVEYNEVSAPLINS